MWWWQRHKRRIPQVQTLRIAHPPGCAKPSGRRQHAKCPFQMEPGAAVPKYSTHLCPSAPPGFRTDHTAPSLPAAPPGLAATAAGPPPCPCTTRRLHETRDRGRAAEGDPRAGLRLLQVHDCDLVVHVAAGEGKSRTRCHLVTPGKPVLQLSVTAHIWQPAFRPSPWGASPHLF